MIRKLKGRMDKRGHYDVQIKRWMQKGHYDVQMKGRMDNGHYDVEILKGGC